MAMGSLEANSWRQKTSEVGANCKIKVHEFYLVKFWPYKLQPDEASKLSEAENLIEQLDQETTRIRKDRKIERAKGREYSVQLNHLYRRSSSIESGLEWQQKLLDHLQQALDHLNSFSKTIIAHKAGSNTNTHVFQCGMVRGCRNLGAENKVLREIGRSQRDVDPKSLLAQEYMTSRWMWWYANPYQKIDRGSYTLLIERLKQIEERKQKLLFLADDNNIIWSPLTMRTAIEEQIRVVKKITVELRREESEVMPAIEHSRKMVEAIYEDGFYYRCLRSKIQERKNAAQRRIVELKQRIDMSGRYEEYLSLISNARELARKKDVAALRQLSQEQVDKFMSEWNHKYDRSLRRNYEIDAMRSLENRRLSSDGRIRKPWDQQTLAYIEGSNLSTTFT